MTALLAATRHWDGPSWPWFPLIPLLFVALWSGLVLLVVRGRWCRRGAWPAGESVLGERFARGEIDEAEYRARLAVLRHRS